MTRPRLLDLFCGAGGAAMGYHRAGFDVVGVDLEPMPRYPFTFHQGDAMTWPLEGFDVIHASPPCHGHSSLNAVNGIDYATEWMLPATIERLKNWGGAWVVENVANASGLMGPCSLQLCGSEFGLSIRHRSKVVQLRRHRLFTANVWLWGAGGCIHEGFAGGVYGGAQRIGGAQNKGVPGWCLTTSQAQSLMGIDWMTRDELDEAIPPAYTEWIGTQLLDALGVAA